MMRIPIFLSSDNNYAPFVATTIASICDNTNSFCEFYVLDGGIREENRIKIESLKLKFKNFSLEFIRIDERWLSSIDYRTATPYVTISTYNRLLIPQLKTDIDRALYSDVDVIVLGDIAKMYNENLHGHIIGAIADECAARNNNLKRLKSFGFPSANNYFNAGNLLIDCKKWRENNVTEELFLVEKRFRDKLGLADQDVMNIYFQNNFQPLSNRYCYFAQDAFSPCQPKDLVVRHFAGRIKPWQADFYIDPTTSRPKYLEHVKEFWKYVAITPFCDEIRQIKEKFLSSSLIYRRYNARVNGLK